MSRLAIETKLGLVEFKWSVEGRLKELHLNIEKENSNVIRTPRSMIASGQIPVSWLGFIDQFVNYLETGIPVEPVSWDMIDSRGWTEFQSAVYQSVAQIPIGETRGYKWVAEKIRNYSACRAVGQALKKNPLPVIVPCHRVISSSGGIGGFLGKTETNDPEILIKKLLLSIEDQYLNPPFPFLLKLQG